MPETRLKAAYDPEKFREDAHAMVDRLADYLKASFNGDDKVITYQDPDAVYKRWKNGNFKDATKALFEDTIRIHNPRYMGHQISPTLPETAITAMISAMLNNGMGVYEMGAAPTVMERLVAEHLCTTLGYPEGSGGFLTSGGTLATLTALLCARRKIAPSNVWEDGHGDKLAIMVSGEAHYCADRAARIMGLGEQGIIRVPVDEDYRIRTDLLENAWDKAKADGLTIFAIVGSAPSTATGMYDDLQQIAAFSAKHRIWFHVDGAHGGAAMFSGKYRHLLAGAKASDSFAVDGHKMMMMPAITTALLFKDVSDSHRTFRQQAEYLLAEGEGDWHNLAKRTFECTKYMMSLHWHSLISKYGNDLFDDFVTNLYDKGHQFGELIAAEEDFELAVTPMSNIVCFRHRPGKLAPEKLDAHNEKIRQALLKDGEFYVVSARLKGAYWMRCTLMNPFTSAAEYNELLKKIRVLARQLA